MVLARRWLASVIHCHEVVISSQVLLELGAVAGRTKLHPPRSGAQISELLEALAGFVVVTTVASPVLDAQLRLQPWPPHRWS